MPLHFFLSLTWQGSSYTSPPVQVTETRSSLLDFVPRFSSFSSIGCILFHFPKLTVPILYVLKLIILRVPLDQFILLSTSGEPPVLICCLQSILQSTVCNVPSQRACLIRSLLPILLCASTNSIQVPFLLPEDYPSDIRSSFANRHIAPS
jgi:hypothetical protein